MAPATEFVGTMAMLNVLIDDPAPVIVTETEPEVTEPEVITEPEVTEPEVIITEEENTEPGHEE
jgi:hypothetical protein